MNGRGIDFFPAESAHDKREYDYLISTDSFNHIDLGSRGLIFGPHISLELLHNLPEGKNIYFNTLSNWLKDLATEVFGDKNFINLPFPVDVDIFKPSDKVGKPVLYFKRRDNKILDDFLKDHQLTDFHFYDYEKRYSENIFMKSISEAPYAIWIGCHESQGFAMQETLSSNTPVFVIDSKDLREETGGYWDNRLNGHNLPCTSASYFDRRCGIISDKYKWRNDIEWFKNNLNTYSPRDFITETLSPEACIKKWKITLNG